MHITDKFWNSKYGDICLPDNKMPNKFYGYIYFTINTINGKKYVGKHKYPGKHINPIDFSYIGSGKYLGNAIRKYGKSAFVTIIFEYCSSLKELNTREEFWISYFDACKREDFYNISLGGTNCDNFTHNPNKEAYRKKLSIAKTGTKMSEESKKRLSLSLKGNKISDYCRQRSSECNSGKGNPMYGVPSPIKGKHRKYISATKFIYV